MRFNEIESGSEDAIIKKIKRYVKGTCTVDNGVININGDFELTRMMSKLPVYFGTCTGDFYITENRLTTLEGSPTRVEKTFNCFSNPLITSLKGGPEWVDSMNCSHCEITNLIGAPKFVRRHFYAICDNLQSLEGIPEIINDGITLRYDKNLPMLRLLTVKRLSFISFTKNINDTVLDILNKHLGTGRGGMLACAAELTKAGFKGNARM